jgi:hypothetical protein
MHSKKHSLAKFNVNTGPIFKKKLIISLITAKKYKIIIYSVFDCILNILI